MAAEDSHSRPGRIVNVQLQGSAAEAGAQVQVDEGRGFAHLRMAIAAALGIAAVELLLDTDGAQVDEIDELLDGDTLIVVPADLMDSDEEVVDGADGARVSHAPVTTLPELEAVGDEARSLIVDICSKSTFTDALWSLRQLKQALTSLRSGGQSRFRIPRASLHRVASKPAFLRFMQFLGFRGDDTGHAGEFVAAAPSVPAQALAALAAAVSAARELLSQQRQAERERLRMEEEEQQQEEEEQTRFDQAAAAAGAAAAAAADEPLAPGAFAKACSPPVEAGAGSVPEVAAAEVAEGGAPEAAAAVEADPGAAELAAVLAEIAALKEQGKLAVLDRELELYPNPAARRQKRVVEVQLDEQQHQDGDAEAGASAEQGGDAEAVASADHGATAGEDGEDEANHTGDELAALLEQEAMAPATGAAGAGWPSESSDEDDPSRVRSPAELVRLQRNARRRTQESTLSPAQREARRLRALLARQLAGRGARVRITFPDSITIIATFSPFETAGDLAQFVADCCSPAIQVTGDSLLLQCRWLNEVPATAHQIKNASPSHAHDMGAGSAKNEVSGDICAAKRAKTLAELRIAPRGAVKVKWRGETIHRVNYTASSAAAAAAIRASVRDFRMSQQASSPPAAEAPAPGPASLMAAIRSRGAAPAERAGPSNAEPGTRSVQGLAAVLASRLAAVAPPEDAEDEPTAPAAAPASEGSPRGRRRPTRRRAKPPRETKGGWLRRDLQRKLLKWMRARHAQAIATANRNRPRSRIVGSLGAASGTVALDAAIEGI